MIPLIGAHDFPYLFIDQAASLWTLPLTWGMQSHDSLGVFTLSTLWTWVYGLLYGLSGKLGIDFTVSTWVLGILPSFLLSWSGMGRLLKSYELSRQARLIGQLLYSANTYLLMLVDGGQLSLGLAYSLLPWALAYLANRSKFVLILATISFLDIRYLYILAIPVALKAISDYKNISKYLVTGVLATLILAGLHSYWLLPAIFTRGPALPPNYTRGSQVKALSFANLSNALFMVHPHWPKNIFGKIDPVPRYFFLIPILVFTPLFLKKRSIVGLWSVVALIAVFFTKGSNPPLSGVYGFLFSNVPGFSLFRDPTKFFSLITLAYGVLIAFTAEWLWSKAKWFYAFLPVYLVLLLMPLNQATGLLSVARHQEEYRQLAEYLDEDSSPGSIVWVPSKPPLGYSSPIHPSLDARVLLDKRPFATGVIGNYDLLNFLRDASQSGQLLDIAGVKYLGISAVDRKRDSLKPEDLEYHEIFSQQLAGLPWIKQVYKFGEITVLETENHQPIVFMPKITNFVVGPDDIYPDQNLAETGLVFVESQPEMLAHIVDFPSANLVLNRKNGIDAAGALLERKYIIFPSNNLDFDPDTSGWWKRETSDLIAWRNFLQQKYNLDNQDFDYGGGWAVSEGEQSIKINTPECQSDCILLARVMRSSKGGKIVFSTNGEINTLELSPAKTTKKLTGFAQTPDQFFTYDQANFHWHEVGNISQSEIEIRTEGEINVVNALAVLPKSTWDGLKKQVESLSSRQFQESSGQVEFTKVNSAHYKVKVSGLQSPGTLAFGQNYDTLWQLDGKSGVPMYSMINGFPVSGDGEYDLVFLPQRYVLPGLTITVVALLLLIYMQYADRKSTTHRHD